MENISDKEELIFSQIKSYKDSQSRLINLIESNIDVGEYLKLYLVNDEWLELWKQYSCYNEIKNNPSLNKEKWKEIRKRNKADNITLPDMQIKKLFLNSNNNNNDSTIKNYKIDSYSNFHLLDEECFLELCKGQNNKYRIRIKFEIKAGKIMARNIDKILILYKNESRLNFIFLIFSNVNIINEIYSLLQNMDVTDFLIKLKIDPNCEKQEIIFNDYKMTFLNKSFNKIKADEGNFKEVISSLIDYEYNLFPQLKLSEIIINKHLYLINNNWFSNLKNSLKYIGSGNNKKISDINQAEIINKIFEKYKINPSLIRDEIIKDENNSYEYLKENKSGNFFKLYSNYSLISEELWFNLIQIFKWHIEIKVNVYIIKNNIIVMYNENDFEIYEILNGMKENNIFFHIFESMKTNQVIDEIKNLGISNYYNKYNINISQEKQIYFKLFDNMNNFIGFAFNINGAKKNFKEFSYMIYEQMDENELKNLHIGYNAKNNNISALNNFNNNNNINSNNNNNLNNIINNHINIGNFNNQNINNNFENLNIQISNINLNQKNNNNDIKSNYKKINPKKDINSETKDVLNLITERERKNRENKDEDESKNTTLEFINKNAPDLLKTRLNSNTKESNPNLIKNNNDNINNNINNNINYNMINNFNNNINNNNFINNNIATPYMHNMNYNNSNNFNNFNNNFNFCPNQDFGNVNINININLNNQNQINNNNYNNNNNQNCLNNQNIFQNQINNNLDNFAFPRNDLLKSIVLCLNNCQIVFENIINIYEQQFMPIISSLKYIFQTNDYNNGLSNLKVNLNRALNQIMCLDEPKDVFNFIIERITDEIGGFNSNQNNSLIQYNNSTNKDSIYKEFLIRIFNPNNNTFISHNFFGIREVISTCFKCEKEHFNFEIFKFLEFSVEEVNNFLVKKLCECMQGDKNKYLNNKFARINANNLENLITINDCFDYYSNHNYHINNYNTICNDCKIKSENLNVKYELKKMPNILCVFIKNKKENEYKVSVKLEEKINLSKYLKSADIKEYYLNSAIIYSKQDDRYYPILKGRYYDNWEIYLENNISPVNLQQIKIIGFPSLLIYKSKD